MPAFGKPNKKKPHSMFGARDNDNRPMLSNPYSVSNPRKVDQSNDPKVNVNRTNKGDFRSSVFHKNQRKDPTPRIQGSDDMTSVRRIEATRRRKQRI